jgi:hypothetical protein
VRTEGLPSSQGQEMLASTALNQGGNRVIPGQWDGRGHRLRFRQELVEKFGERVFDVNGQASARLGGRAWHWAKEQPGHSHALRWRIYADALKWHVCVDIARASDSRSLLFQRHQPRCSSPPPAQRHTVGGKAAWSMSGNLKKAPDFARFHEARPEKVPVLPRM